MSAMARRLSSSCSRAVASSSSKSIPSSSSLPPRRIYTLPSRPLLLASSPLSPPFPLPPPHTPTRSSFTTLAAAKGSTAAATSSSVSPTQKKYRSTKEEGDMTISSSVKLAGGTLSVCGRTVLSGLPDAVVASSAAAGGAVDGVFVGADFNEPAARHVVSLGDLRGVRFMACFRFKLWWMAQRMGEKGGDVPRETQFLLVESKGSGAGNDEAAAYVVFLLLVEGAFRASIQGGAGDALELCVDESDPFAAISFGQVRAQDDGGAGRGGHGIGGRAGTGRAGSKQPSRRRKRCPGA